MISAGQLKIGPVQYHVHVPNGSAVRYSDPAYGGFWSDAGGRDTCSPRCAGSLAIEPFIDVSVHDQPLMTLPVYISRESKAIPIHEPVYRGGKNWALWEDGDHLVICSGFYEQPVARIYCRLSRDLTSAQVFLDPAREGAESEPLVAPLRYPLDQILSWGLLSRCSGIIMHASVAVKDGVGWVFTGRSGAGKSTISGLCHQSGWRILNDDRIIVYPRDGLYRVAGTPWHGSGRFAEAAEVPLGGIFFLHKSTGEMIEEMSPSDARFALLDVAAIPWFESTWSQGSLTAVEQLLDHARFHKFYFSRTPAAVRALEQYQRQDAGVSA